MKFLLLPLLLFTNLIAGDYIDIYSAYTNGKRVIVSGRIIDTKDKKSKESKVISSFFNDEKKEVNIRLKVNQLYFREHSDSEGYFSFDIEVAPPLNASASLQTDEKKSLQSFQLFQPTTQATLGVISDFDDTIVVSNVTKKSKLFYNIFIKGYKERVLIEEVKKKILQFTQKQNRAALFFITGSPHQLHNTINAFLDYHGIPKRTLLTKKIHGEKSDSLLATVDYKYDKIVKLIEMYPYIKWVMFGDNGEKDPQVYQKVLKNYPKHVHAIYIRNIKSNKLDTLYKK